MNVLRPIHSEFYGDNTRWFVGTVINGTPPQGLEGRVKVRIKGVHDRSTVNIKEGDLPWAQVLLPGTEGGSSGFGRIPQLLPGALVFGMFLDGKTSQLPVILGSLPKTEFPVRATQTRLQNMVATPLLDDALTFANVGLRRSQSMKFFIDNGYTLLQAAAITGNLQSESFFQTSSNNSSKNGIAGWKVTNAVNSRFEQLKQFAVEFEPVSDWTLFSIQLQFVLYELRGRFNSVNNRLLNAATLEDACTIVSKYYLKSKNTGLPQAKRAFDEVING